jgi:hypothetical protein
MTHIIRGKGKYVKGVIRISESMMKEIKKRGYAYTLINGVGYRIDTRNESDINKKKICQYQAMIDGLQRKIEELKQ